MQTQPRPAFGLGARVAAGLLAACAMVLAACSETPEAIETRPVLRDTPSVLRGTIGSEVTFRGIEPVVVSGLGLVVNLNNTGGLPIPDRILETMERNLALQGVSSTLQVPGTALDRKTPREVLRDPRTAVVIVSAAIPPGAPAGATFDIYVEAVNASSLEGGQLWTTALRIGETVLFGQATTRELASARGPIFVNPFAETEPGSMAPSQTTGRVLDGGIVTNPLKIEMIPDTASHSRVASMVSAINSRIPEAPGDPGDTASGKTTSDINSGPAVVLRVPRRYSKRASEFLNLIKYMPIVDIAPEMMAKRYTDALKAEPALSRELSWCLEAVGQKSLPFVRGLYDYAEVVPRLAALRAGARLGDPLAAAPLMTIATSGTGLERLEAIQLLAEIEGSPRIDMTLRTLLMEKELLIRTAAYEALAKRAERIRMARFENLMYSEPGSPLADISPMHREVIATGEFPPGMIQGIERRSMGGKFLLDLVPMGEPLIYVTQQGKPRIVIFGEQPSFRSPGIVAAWNDRLLMNAVEGEPGVRMMFRQAEGEQALRLNSEGNSLAEIVQLFSLSTSTDQPQPGFNFTYSEVVGALYAMSDAKVTDATFATEQDRLKAGILAAGEEKVRRDRPETPDDPQSVVVIRRVDSPNSDMVPKKETPKAKIVPLPGSGKKAGEPGTDN